MVHRIHDRISAYFGYSGMGTAAAVFCIPASRPAPTREGVDFEVVDVGDDERQHGPGGQGG